MAENAKDSFSSALTLFSSLYEDMNPSNLPEGLSPANQDMSFLPGSVGTRAALHKLFPAPDPNTPTILSLDDFPTPNGDFFLTELDSLGFLRWKGVSGASASALVTPAVQFKAETAFDKQFFGFFNADLAAAFSLDSFVGVDVPRYYDGNAAGTVFRVTSDAPGANCALADLNPTVNITSVNTNVGITIVAAPNGATEVGLVATIATTAPHGFKVGDSVSVTGVAVGGYNNTVGSPWIITTVPSPTTFTFTAGTAGLANSGGGAANPLLATVITATPHGLNVGDPVVISGNAQPNYNNLPLGGPTPNSWIVTSIPNASAFTFIAISNPGAGAGGSMTVGGMVIAGPRNCVVIFDVNGALTAPSVPIQFISAGARQIQATTVPIGPPGTRRRILAFTQAFGSSYYYITPAKVPGIAGLPTVFSVGTIINDNTTTTLTMDFSDAQLASSTQIDVEGNNLFNQIVLAPCLGVIEYQGRMNWWGEINNIKNLINYGFEGGPIVVGVPPGWVNTNSTGGIVNTDIGLGLGTGVSYSMGSAAGARDCLISQSAFQDYYGAPIFQPKTTYIFRCLTQRTIGAVAGNLIAELFSATSGSLATATIPVSGILAGGAGPGWSVATFSAATPAQIPADTVIRIYLQNVTNGTGVNIDELEFINQATPVLNTQLRSSYFGNPFGYDVITGVIGLDTSDSITACFKQRDYLYPLTTKGRFVTQNNGSTEPSGWDVSEQESECGCSSPCAVDVTEGVAFWMGQYGRRVFTGGAQSKLISLEVQNTFETINWKGQLSTWVTVDPIERIVHFGVPTGAFLTPNIDLPISYRAVDSAYNVPDPIRQSYSGRMIALELCRKSTIWNIKANCATMATRVLPSGEGNAAMFVLGGGNGLKPGLGAGFGNSYYLDPAKFTDDDYGIIGAGTGNFYTTYALWSHDLEQSVQLLGSHRKIYTYISIYVTGVGLLSVTPFVNSLGEPWVPQSAVFNPVTQVWENAGVPQPLPSYQLSADSDHYLEWGLNITGERVFFKISVSPLPGHTDASFSLQDVVVSGRMENILPVRGAVL